MEKLKIHITIVKILGIELRTTKWKANTLPLHQVDLYILL